MKLIRKHRRCGAVVRTVEDKHYCPECKKWVSSKAVERKIIFTR